jgi:hypothetical protein
MAIRSIRFFVFAQVIIFLVTNLSCGSNEKELRLMKEGNIIIGKIEQFKKEHGRLPDSLSDLGVDEKEEGPLHYEKRSDTEYLLWFGTELGESIVYNSKNKKWNGQASHD